MSRKRKRSRRRKRRNWPLIIPTSKSCEEMRLWRQGYEEGERGRQVKMEE